MSDARALLSLLAILGGCSAEPSVGPLDVHVHGEQCPLQPGCELRFELFSLRESCVQAWAIWSGGGGELALEPVDLLEGKVQVLATCQSERCVQCYASASFGAGTERLDLQLEKPPRCDVAAAVTAPCAECGPASSQPYCHGDQRVTCVGGRPQLELCPLGCVAGACKTCQRQSYYRDADGDGYGDPDVSFMDCTRPEGYVENREDCDDGDKRARPGQSEFYTEPSLGKQSFDYDCSYATERRHEERAGCYVDSATKTCLGHGWKDGPPACGVKGTWVTCQVLFEHMIPFCIGVWSTRTQACH